MTSTYLFSFRDCKTFEDLEKCVIGHICRSSFHMPGVTVIQCSQHLNR